ncbi:hypothetical protein T492DRAFT_831824 [Pavlovales sp. CCMP2436]|nr:hypothetical protein T492DRAFT_831824 [Pavlovales sp. CCMP2436]
MYCAFDPGSHLSGFIAQQYESLSWSARNSEDPLTLPVGWSSSRPLTTALVRSPPLEDQAGPSSADFDKSGSTGLISEINQLQRPPINQLQRPPIDSRAASVLHSLSAARRLTRDLPPPLAADETQARPHQARHLALLVKVPRPSHPLLGISQPVRLTD